MVLRALPIRMKAEKNFSSEGNLVTGNPNPNPVRTKGSCPIRQEMVLIVQDFVPMGD